MTAGFDFEEIRSDGNVHIKNGFFIKNFINTYLIEN